MAGACPSRLRPYRIRDETKTQAEPLEMADVHTTALMMEGTTEMPARTNAMTKGDCCAVPVEMVRLGSSNGLLCIVSLLFDTRSKNQSKNRDEGCVFCYYLHDHADNEYAQHVEAEDSVEGLLGGRGDDLARVLRLGPGNGHNLDVSVAEGGSQ